MRKALCFVAMLVAVTAVWAQDYKAKYDDTYKYGYVDSGGKWVIAPQFDYVSDFKSGFGAVTVDKKDGLIDAKGKFIIPCQWDDINTYYLDKGMIIVKKDDKYGLLDGKGRQLIACEWSDINCSNADCDSIVVEKGDLAGAFNLKGEQVLPCKFDKGFIKNQWGYYDVSIGKKYGLYDGNGNELVPCKYEETGFFPDERGFVSVTMNGKQGLCDTNGIEVIPCEYSSLYFNKNDDCYSASKEDASGKTEGLYAKTGKMLFPCKYEIIGLMSGKYYWGKLNGKDVYYDLNLREIGDPYAVSAPAEEGVKLSGNWSFNVDNSAKRTTLTGDKIENKSSTANTGRLMLRLFLTTSKYSGGDITGYVAFEANFDPLKNGYYYYDIDKWYAYPTIPDGKYYATLCLMEDDDGYTIVDYLGFDNLISIDNSSERLRKFADALNQTSNALNALTNPTYSTVPNQPAPNGNGSTQRQPLRKVREDCSFCHGTGKNPGKVYPPSFGLERTYDQPPCPICGDRDAHSHKTCPSCNGKGYTEKYSR